MISAPTVVDIILIEEEHLRLGSRETVLLYGSQREADVFSSNSMQTVGTGLAPVRLVLLRLCIGFADSGLPQGQSLRWYGINRLMQISRADDIRPYRG